jgi:hypothetical protein
MEVAEVFSFYLMKRRFVLEIADMLLDWVMREVAH